jgi:phosphate transport system substrate-binding protein
VEPFATKSGAEKLRAGVIAELQKDRGLTLADSANDADLILGGGGEIWVKGYQSLNPRSGRSPSGGTPVYGGYLSVELRDKNGATLWSYLATPSGNGDVVRDLARNIGRRVMDALPEVRPESAMAPGASVASIASGRPPVQLHGAGATFPYPVYEKWFANYHRLFPDVQIAYDAVGSETGIGKLLAGETDFGASDSPDAIHALAPADEGKYLFFPAVVGAVAPIVNLPGFTGEVSFTPEALAGIYLGTIRKWNDPVLVKANRGLHLPDLDIVVVHRADGSGTSYAWTDFLSNTSPEWKDHVGTGLSPQWPVGRAASGNDGVAKLVKELGGSIGYVEFIYALRNQLSYGRIRNSKGEFVAAGLEGIAAAANQDKAIGDDLKVSIVNAPGPGAYPVSSYTWFVVPEHVADGVRRNAIKAFLKWMIGPGQMQAAALGYLPLPKDLVAREIQAIDRIH